MTDKTSKTKLAYKSAAEIRASFIDYFASKGHTHVPSASLVPAGDPTLLFTNSGMVPFKDLFLGQEKRDYTRAVSAQRCVRAGGKHNDLENVGWTARHHTFFEMMGNFSFGDYFKEDAIQYAWEFVTKNLGLPADKLWITVHHSDQEAADIWHKKIGVPLERIAALDEDNFWQMGDTGPCGPCSEIFYDHGPEVEGDPPGGPNEGDRYIEIWNLVFMQFNRSADGKMTPLPKPSVDTGMGLERVAAVLQGVYNNYDTDLFTEILKEINKLSGGKNKKSSDLASQRIIADHIRSASFLIADGVIPSSEGRGYVLRRIIRRALRHGNKLKIASPFFHKLVEPLAVEMGEAHPLIKTQQHQVAAMLNEEEEKFSKTLEQGLSLLAKEKANISGKLLSGEVTFKLYDTYGFPPDLTEDIGREQGFRVDWDGFEAAMEEQRKRSRAYSMFQKQDYSMPAKTPASKFVGYDKSEAEAKLLAIIDESGKAVDKIKQGDEALLVLDQTPFYAESGGQVGDQGSIMHKDSGAKFKVVDTQKQDNFFLHFGVVEEGELAQGSEVTAQIDADRRQQIAKHHTAAHLLHTALHKHVGEHAQQRGSRVAADSVRLDFAHSQMLSNSQLEDIEDSINDYIRAGTALETALMPVEKAKAAGAMALFGEKYGAEVRVVDIPGFSKELCGGTHVANTRDIGEFILVKEQSISAGVRRIEGVVADTAKDERHRQRRALNKIKLLIASSDPEEITQRIQELLLKVDKQQKDLQKHTQGQQLADSIKKLDKQLESLTKVGEVPLLFVTMEDLQSNVLNQLADHCRQKMPSGVVVFANKQKDRSSVLVTCSQDLKEKYPASELMTHLLKPLNGSGGGNAQRAQGGGDGVSAAELDKIISTSKDWIKNRG